MSLALACALSGCAARHVPVLTVADSSYIDLEPGWRLRVVTPLLKSGGYRLNPGAAQVNGHTVTITAGTDFLGYETACYAVTARHGIRFLSAETTRNGTTVPQPRPVARLFQLPPEMRRTRLIYLLRVSRTDHDMAVVAARNAAALDALTRRVLANPAESCRSGRDAACEWIPAGIAVVPEVRRKAAWVPAR